MNLIGPISVGDVAKIVELLVAVIGFSATIVGLYQAKAAALRAEKAAIRAKDAIIHSQTLTDFGAAVTMMDEIKRLHRVEAWAIVPERYSALRAILISIRSSNPTLSSEHLASLQGVVKNLRDFEGIVEKSLASKKQMPSPAKFNSIVSAQIDKLNEILTVIKQDIER